jgi:hypothetical protein
MPTAILEVYSYQMQLVSYQRSNIAPVVPPQGIGFVWDGKDMDGKAVQSGKYVAKLSMLSLTDTTCECVEIFIKN